MCIRDRFKQGAKEIMEDKSGINNMSDGNRDETENDLVRAELMKNAVTMREMDFDDLPEKAKIYVKAIEKFIETKISSISTSPEREDTILLIDPFN